MGQYETAMRERMAHWRDLRGETLPRPMYEPERQLLQDLPGYSCQEAPDQEGRGEPRQVEARAPQVSGQYRKVGVGKSHVNTPCERAGTEATKGSIQLARRQVMRLPFPFSRKERCCERRRKRSCLQGLSTHQFAQKSQYQKQQDEAIHCFSYVTIMSTYPGEHISSSHCMQIKNDAGKICSKRRIHAPNKPTAARRDFVFIDIPPCRSGHGAKNCVCFAITSALKF
jgi:hypothetical protein